jgi:hypothetical protein
MLDKSHTRLMTFLNTHEINSMLDYDTLDFGTLDITASPVFFSFIPKSSQTVKLRSLCFKVLTA